MRKFIISAVVAAVAAVSFAAPSQAGHYGYKSHGYSKHYGYKKNYGYKKHHGGQYGYKKHRGSYGYYGYNGYNGYNGLSFSFGYY